VLSIPHKKSSKGVVFKVRVQPRSAKKEVCGLVGDRLKIKLNAPPVGGAANEELIELLSETLHVRKSSIRILRGLASKDKTIEIEGMESLS
jgi:uncharacterized protein (TIGR00251 family)